MLLRGTAATAPTILTLASGAALAQSSNLIGTIQSSSGDALCLNPASTDGPLPSNPNIYDLGAPAYGEVTRFPDTNGYRDKNNPSRALSASEACKLNTGTLQVRYNYSGQWTDKPRNAGFVISNAAWASFGSRLYTTDI